MAPKLSHFEKKCALNKPSRNNSLFRVSSTEMYFKTFFCLFKFPFRTILYCWKNSSTKAPTEKFYILVSFQNLMLQTIMYNGKKLIDVKTHEEFTYNIQISQLWYLMIFSRQWKHQKYKFHWFLEHLPNSEITSSVSALVQLSLYFWDISHQKTDAAILCLLWHFISFQYVLCTTKML